jgi:hypothetical protein
VIRPQCWRRCILALAVASALGAAPAGGELLIGWASADITPDRPAPLAGQFHTRVSKSVHDPILATVLALEGRGGGSGQAILVACDLVVIVPTLEAALRERVKERLPDFDSAKLVLNATHTHTAPETRDGVYEIPAGVMTPAEYRAFAVERIVPAIEQAWKGRKPGGVSWSLGRAVVGYNRRSSYANGTAQMYGRTDRPDFRRMEGYEDHGLELLYLWDAQNKLTGVVINVACPSQVVEGEYYISADFWHDVRKLMGERHAERPFVYPMVGAAGDQSPHPQFRKRAEQRLRERLGMTECEEIAHRIVDAVDYALPAARKDIRQRVPFVHKVEDLRLPVRAISGAEAATARQEYEQYMKLPETDRTRHVRLRRAKDVMARYERQSTEPYYPMRMHAVRLGDIAIVTNPFELYLDFGIQMKARSPAEQTFVVQLAGGGTYLPTAKAVAGGHYGAEAASNMVGPEGGQLLVDRTVDAIEALWKEEGRVP